MAIVISVSNQKGGVGKTATTSALAYGLKDRGYNVLVADADGQCNTTDAFQAIIEGQATLYDLFERTADISEAIQHTEHIDIIAGDTLLKQADTLYGAKAGREYRLREALEPVKEQYDFIIIDTIPGTGVMLLNALTAADYVLIPMGADRDSLQGLSQLNVIIQETMKYSNKDLKILGFLITRAKENVDILKDVLDAMPSVEEYVKAKTYKTIIRDNIHVQNARAAFMPIIEYQKKNRRKNVLAVTDYEQFIDELLADLKMKKRKEQ